MPNQTHQTSSLTVFFSIETPLFRHATFYLAELFRQATFYLAELFCQATFYLAELFRQAMFYLVELFRQATFYLAELFRQITSLYFIYNFDIFYTFSQIISDSTSTKLKYGLLLDLEIQKNTIIYFKSLISKDYYQMIAYNF